MFFCEKCHYLYNVTKDVKSKQTGGKINDRLNNIFTKFNEKDKITEADIKKIKGKDIMEDERFENMTKKEQRKMISSIKLVDKNFFVEEDIEQKTKIGNTSSYFICKYCKHYKPIKPQTIIYSKKYRGDSNIETEDYTYAIYDNTLPRTKNYICQNEKCETHKKDDLKEAILVKNNLDQIVYVCGNCTTHWIHTI